MYFITWGNKLLLLLLLPFLLILRERRFLKKRTNSRVYQEPQYNAVWFGSVSAVSLVVAAARLGVSVTYSLRTIAHPHTPSTPPQPRTISLSFILSLRFYFCHSSKRGGETGLSSYSYLPGHWRWWHYDDLLLRSPLLHVSPQSTHWSPHSLLMLLKY